MPLEVIYGPKQDNSIWEALSGIITQISDTFQKRQQIKAENELMLSAINAIESYGTPDEVKINIDALNNIPEERTNPEGLDIFSKNVAGLLSDYGALTGFKPKVISGTPQTTSIISQPELKYQGEQLSLPQQTFNQIYNVIDKIDTKQPVNWDEPLGIIKKQLEQGKQISSFAQNLLNQILQEKQPKEQLGEYERKFGLAKNWYDVLYPGEEKPNSELEYWLQENPNKGVEDYWKAKKEPTTTLDTDALNTFMKDNNLKLKGVTVNEKGERNISLEPIEGGEPNLSDMLILIKKLEEQGFNASYSKNGLSVGIPGPKTPESEKPLTISEMNYVDKQFEEVTTNEQYDIALNKVKTVNPQLANQAPSKEKIFKANYDDAMSAIKSCIDNNGQIIEGDNPNDEGYTYAQSYQTAYDALQTAIQEYKLATGVTLPDIYLSYEDYLKSDIKPKNYWYPSTWGQQKSVNK
jgi:hypothetical protein